MGIADFIGNRGEAIAFTRLTAMCRDGHLPYFLPHHLGEKCETFDFLVELVGVADRTPYFFVQVKATRRGLTQTQSSPRLPVQVHEADVRRMLTFPAPTYVIGVQDEAERAFVVSVHGNAPAAIPSVTTAHELNADTLRRLWDEVREFWQVRDTARSASWFTN
jgi:hypothetical protein